MNPKLAFSVCGIYGLLALSTVFGQATKLDRATVQGLVDGMAKPLLEGKPPLKSLVVGVLCGQEQMIFDYGQLPADTSPGDVLFQIQSVTKPLTALLLAKLVAEGKIRYEDVAIEFQDQPVTYHQLVTHTSGLPVLPPKTEGSYTADDFRAFLQDHALANPPGAKFEYSTAGYAVLGAKLAEANEAPSFEEVLKVEVLQPLKMESTDFFVAEENQKRYAGDPAKAGPKPNVFNPSGGLVSSANDLLKLLAANVDLEGTPDLKEALALTQQVNAEIKTFPQNVAAQGWQVITPMNFYWHSGVGSRSRCLVTFDPRTKCGIVLLTNTGLPPMDARLEMAGFSLLGGLMQLSAAAAAH